MPSDLGAESSDFKLTDGAVGRAVRALGGAAMFGLNSRTAPREENCDEWAREYTDIFTGEFTFKPGSVAGGYEQYVFLNDQLTQQEQFDRAQERLKNDKGKQAEASEYARRENGAFQNGRDTLASLDFKEWIKVNVSNFIELKLANALNGRPACKNDCEPRGPTLRTCHVGKKILGIDIAKFEVDPESLHIAYAKPEGDKVEAALGKRRLELRMVATWEMIVIYELKCACVDKEDDF